MTKDEARELAEKFLREMLAYNVEHEIWPAENAVIRRMLNRREPYWPELPKYYAAVYGPLLTTEGNRVMEAMVSAVVAFSISNTTQLRNQLKIAAALSEEIAQHAAEIARLIRERVENCPDVSQPPGCHPLNLIELAAECSGTRFRFESWVRPALRKARSFDSRYWPDIPELLEALAKMELDHRHELLCMPLAAAVYVNRESAADVVRVVLACLDELILETRYSGGELCRANPAALKLSNAAIAAFLNGTISPEQPFTEESVRKRRKDYDTRIRDSLFGIE
ncbi:MAG: hypothetical protein KDH88_17595 [Chromatiales bacterium]|nr:hypothetical protein [Chromatiales bacterium]